ncbi:uncharacterized protein LOC143043840 [Mytilus galloprovincialis]|uniref:uncharacterized protein LOC143043840 n=1 Tax=Mytilus galloprovincialis TaxID=29158 RepID=UPI003F7BED3A
MDMKMEHLQSKIADIEQSSNKYQTDVNGVIHAIREEGKHLKELIDKKVEILVKSVKEEETKNLQILQSNKNEIKAALNKAKEQQKFYQDSQGIKDTTKLVQKLKQIKSQIDKKEEIQIPIMPSVKYVRQIVAECEIEKLFGEFRFGETVKKEENPEPQENVRYREFYCKKCGMDSVHQMDNNYHNPELVQSMDSVHEMDNNYHNPELV